MSQIKEVYPDVQSVQDQVAVRKKFGWDASIEYTDRNVFEVTFTRDDSKAKNKKLKQLEDEFTLCASAEDYIERYNGVYANKKKFKAFNPVVLIILIYVIFQFSVLAIGLCALKLIYDSNPALLTELGLSLTTPEGVTSPITPEWSYDIQIAELGLAPLFAIFGITGNVFTITADIIFNILFYIGIGIGALIVLLIIFMIRRAIRAKRYYKADVEYIDRRKKLLNSKIDELEEEMDKIMEKVNAIN